MAPRGAGTQPLLALEPARIPELSELVRLTKLRWRIERDYQELEQEVGLSHFEGRSWRGFHHHASMSIAAYGYLMAERLRSQRRSKKKPWRSARRSAASTRLDPPWLSPCGPNATRLIRSPRCAA